MATSGPSAALAALALVACVHDPSPPVAAPPPPRALPMCEPGPAITGGGTFARPTPARPRGPNGEPSSFEIQQVVRASLPRVERCLAGWTGQAGGEPLQEWHIVMGFTIQPSGAVSQVCARSVELPDPGVARCIGDVFASLRFPPWREGFINVTYPLRMHLPAPARTR
jgi:hypothetical protein